MKSFGKQIDVSVVTVTKNSAKYISRNIKSVMKQNGVTVQHIVKDGISEDETVNIAKKFGDNIDIVVSEDTGIYDAMNQGFLEAKGDIVAFLNSDDVYVDSDVLYKVVSLFEKTNAAYVYAGIEFVNDDDRVVRRWRTGRISNAEFNTVQIPHPAFFVKKSVLSNIDGPFDSSYTISADLKQQLLLINKYNVSGEYLSRTVVRMRMGGKSTASIGSYIQGWVESKRAWQEVNGKGALLFLVKKVSRKLSGLL